MTTHAHENAVQLAPAAPPVAVTGLSFVGIPLQDWVYIVTIAYTVLSIAWLVYKAVRWHIDRKEPDNGSD